MPGPMSLEGLWRPVKAALRIPHEAQRTLRTVDSSLTRSAPQRRSAVKQLELCPRICDVYWTSGDGVGNIGFFYAIFKNLIKASPSLAWEGGGGRK